MVLERLHHQAARAHAFRWAAIDYWVCVGFTASWHLYAYRWDKNINLRGVCPKTRNIGLYKCSWWTSSTLLHHRCQICCEVLKTNDYMNTISEVITSKKSWSLNVSRQFQKELYPIEKSSSLLKPLLTFQMYEYVWTVPTRRHYFQTDVSS